MYEDEVRQLKKQLNFCLRDLDVDYLDAYFYQNALIYTQQQLHVLKRLEDPLFDEKIWQLKRIDFYHRRVADEPSDLMKEYYRQHIQKAENELERINQMPNDNAVFLPESVIVTALRRLITKEIRNLKLILKKCDELFLSFTYSAKILKIVIPQLKKHKEKRVLGDFEITRLQKLGFMLNQNESQLLISIRGTADELLSKANSLLVEIIFNVFRHLKQFENESYLQFNEKGFIKQD